MASIDVTEILRATSVHQPPAKRSRIDVPSTNSGNSMPLNTATANAEDILAALEDDSTQGVVVDEAFIKKLVSQLEKKKLKNREMRIKHSDDPKKFMDSEIELDTSVQEMHSLATQPDLYGCFVESGGPSIMLSLIGHENTDILGATLNLLQASFLDSSPDVVQRVNVSSALTARQRNKESELNWNRVYRFVAAIIANDDTLPGLNPLEASVVISILDDIQNEAVESMSAEEKAVLKGWLTNIQMADLRDFEPDLPCNRYTAAQVLLDPLRSRLFGCPESASRLPGAPSASAPCVPGLGGDGDGGEESMDVPMPSHDADTPEPTNEVIML